MEQDYKIKSIRLDKNGILSLLLKKYSFETIQLVVISYSELYAIWRIN